MRRAMIVGLIGVVLTAGSLSARQNARELADEGYDVFLEVLAGDQSRLPEALKNMEAARAAAPKDVANLYNLGRAYFYEGLTFNRSESLNKSEGVFAAILQIQPEHTEALSFHGSILTAQSRGADIPKFMRGVGEMTAAIKQNPNNVNNRIVLPFTARNFPPEALAAMGNYHPLDDLKFVRDAFTGGEFYYAPHAIVVMNAFVGEAYLSKGDLESARNSFNTALSQPQPGSAGVRAGRALLDESIRARMNGGSRALGDGGIFSGCHSCHVSKPELLQN